MCYWSELPPLWLSRTNLPVCISGLSALCSLVIIVRRWNGSGPRLVMSHTGTKLPPAKHLGYFLRVLRSSSSSDKSSSNPARDESAQFFPGGNFQSLEGVRPRGSVFSPSSWPITNSRAQEINIEIGELGENGMSLRLILGTSRCQDFTI